MMTSDTLLIALASSRSFSQLLISLSISVLVFSVARRPCTALYVPTESLVLLFCVHAYRSLGIYADLFTLDHASTAINLLNIGLLTLNVHLLQKRAVLTKLSTDGSAEPCTIAKSNAAGQRSGDEEEMKQVESLTQLVPPQGASEAILGLPRSHTICFNRRIFFQSTLWALFTTLYTGEHAPLIHIIAYFTGQPQENFWQDMGVQLELFFMMIELNAFILLLARMGAQRHAQLHAQPPSGATCTDLSAWKARLRSPTSLWVFMWGIQLSAAVLLPSLIIDAKKAKEGARDKLLFRLVGNSMQVVFWLVFVGLYCFLKPRPVQLPVAEGKEQRQTEVMIARVA